jgi:hypothetical protein
MEFNAMRKLMTVIAVFTMITAVFGGGIKTYSRLGDIPKDAAGSIYQEVGGDGVYIDIRSLPDDLKTRFAKNIDKWKKVEGTKETSPGDYMTSSEPEDPIIQNFRPVDMGEVEKGTLATTSGVSVYIKEDFATMNSDLVGVSLADLNTLVQEEKVEEVKSFYSEVEKAVEGKKVEEVFFDVGKVPVAVKKAVVAKKEFKKVGKGKKNIKVVIAVENNPEKIGLRGIWKYSGSSWSYNVTFKKNGDKVNMIFDTGVIFNVEIINKNKIIIIGNGDTVTMELSTKDPHKWSGKNIDATVRTLEK